MAYKETAEATSVTLAKVGSATYSTLQQMQDLFHSAGWSSGGAITAASSTTFDVAVGTGFVRTTASAVGTLKFFDWPQVLGTSVPSQSVRYVGVEYNSGTPQITVRTSYSWNYLTDFPLGYVVNNGSGSLHIVNAPQAVGDHAANMIRRMFETDGVQRDNFAGGLILSELGTRNIAITGGTLWERLSRFTIGPVDTSAAGSFLTYHGTTFIASGITQWPNTAYDNAGVVTTMTANRYANLWWYVTLGGELVMVYGTAEYSNSAQATGELAPSTVPLIVSSGGIIVARLTFQKSASTALQLTTFFDTQVQGALASTHNNLAGLQGGTTAEYYHLTSAESTAFAARSATAGASIIPVSLEGSNLATGFLATGTATTGYSPLSGGSGSAAWGQVSLTAGVTGTLPVANGGTGTTTGVAAHSYQRRDGGVAQGSTNTKILKFPTAINSSGSDLTYNASAENGDSWTVNTAGIYSVNVIATPGAAGYSFIKSNASLNNTVALTDTDILAISDHATAVVHTISWTGYLAANALIWSSQSVATNAGVPRLNAISIVGPL